MILIVDDDTVVCRSLTLLLSSLDYEVVSVTSPARALEVVRSVTPQLVLLDMNFSRSTSGQEGLTLLRQIKIFCPATPVILMTAWGSIELAVEGMRLGAVDFICKPWDPPTLIERIKIHVATVVENNDFDRSLIVGRSSQLQSCLEIVRRVAKTNASVLITGENGTGKELIAETIHRNSLRAAEPFVKVNLGGIPESLFESEMFGHCKGAFTGAVTSRCGRFETANKGTIFLDEIGELSASSQVKMLRVLQEQTFEPLGSSKPIKVDVRVISATNALLPQLVAEGRFREDLFYRLNLISIHVPPLRQRLTDIPLLVNHFANNKAEFTADAMALLQSMPWPGNVRQLKNAVSAAIILNGSERKIDASALRLCLVSQTSVQRPQSDMDRAVVAKALEEANGNISRAAAILGITRQSLYRRMEKYGL